ncbi:hypothetical protein OBBRIDRAFT_788657 [Obba rivulosa]|uniref:Uncharacterized protein n=1 Tax=Obba rivulosa TaxID=1052685 RepID=A0A8E2DT42_9APHY|nr:hypothetical protein OBBRIDRAFT_788657 [Obba rivulosa]
MQRSNPREFPVSQMSLETDPIAGQWSYLKVEEHPLASSLAPPSYTPPHPSSSYQPLMGPPHSNTQGHPFGGQSHVALPVCPSCYSPLPPANELMVWEYAVVPGYSLVPTSWLQTHASLHGSVAGNGPAVPSPPIQGSRPSGQFPNPRPQPRKRNRDGSARIHGAHRRTGGEYPDQSYASNSNLAPPVSSQSVVAFAPPTLASDYRNAAQPHEFDTASNAQQRVFTSNGGYEEEPASTTINYGFMHCHPQQASGEHGTTRAASWAHRDVRDMAGHSEASWP